MQKSQSWIQHIQKEVDKMKTDFFREVEFSMLSYFSIIMNFICITYFNPST